MKSSIKIVQFLLSRLFLSIPKHQFGLTGHGLFNEMVSTAVVI